MRERKRAEIALALGQKLEIPERQQRARSNRSYSLQLVLIGQKLEII